MDKILALAGQGITQLQKFQVKALATGRKK